MERFPLRSILDSLAGRKVMVVGDVVLDEYLQGEVRRVSPEAPVPIVELSGTRYVPGGAGNAAANVVGLGGDVYLGGVVGFDIQADRLRRVLYDAGIECDGLFTDESRPTTTKTRIVARGQQITRLDREQRHAIAGRLESELWRWASERIAKVDVMILSDYGKGVVTPRLASGLLALARSAEIPVVVDPKGTNYSKYQGATVVTPNTSEARIAMGRGDDDDVDRLGEGLLELLPGTAVLITQGEEGMRLFQPAAPPRSSSASARAVFDVTGAGDTVVATLAMAMAAGSDLESAVDLANTAAGIAVGRAGAAIVTMADLQQELARAGSALTEIGV